MSRPKPRVLLQHIDPEDFDATEVLAAETVYALMYDGMAVNIRTRHTLVDYPGPKYKRVAFTSPGHAFNLAERLNGLFKTDRFSVAVAVAWRAVAEGDGD